MTESADNTESTPEGSGEGKARRARERLTEVGGKVSRKVSDTARSAGERTEAAREAATENLKAGVDRVKKDLDELTDDVQKYVNDNPGRSVLIAAGVGFLVGLLVRGGRR